MDMSRYKLLLTLDDVEAVNLKALCAKFGGSPQVQIRRLIQNAIEKEIGGYKSKENNEQVCEAEGLKVAKINGVFYCLYEGTGDELNWKWPLDDIKKGIKIFKKSSKK